MDDTDAGVREFVVYVSIYYRSGEVDTLKLEGIDGWLVRQIMPFTFMTTIQVDNILN